MIKSLSHFWQKKSCPCLRGLLGLFFFFSFVPLHAQNNAEKGLPFITNYPAKIYKALPQTWCIQEDDRGIMYFGIQGYILEYDGVKWKKILCGTTGSSVIRSLAKNKNGIIYYGGSGDMGYLDKDSLGQTISRSLIGQLPAAYRNFYDVWTTYSTDQGIYFQSREYIFRISEKKNGENEKREVKVWKPKTKFMFAFYLDGNYFVHQQGSGLYKMNNDSLEFIPGSEFIGKERMQVMLPYKSSANEKQYLCGLFYSGLYLFDGKTFKPFATKADDVITSGSLLYKGLQLSNGNYVLSTTGKGLVIIDAQGNLLQKINRDVGLQDESVYGVYIDKRGMLWLALDNGISKVDIASPITQFALQSGINTGVLSIKRFEGNLYIGTTNGLLRFNNTNKVFEPVPGIPQNQIFDLLQDGNTLLVPGDGLFAIRDKKAFMIRASVSADLTISGLYISKKYPDILLAGGNYGIALFQRKKDLNKGSGNWQFEGYVSGIPDQIWTFGENKDGSIWCGTQNGVVYKLTLQVDENGHLDIKKTVAEKFGAQNGLINGLGATVNINGVNYFPADSALYIFDEHLQHFKTDTLFGRFPNGGAIGELFMTTDHSQRVWIRFGKETVLATPQKGNGYHLSHPPLNTISESTIQYIYPEDNGIVWFATTDGLVRYDESLVEKDDKSFKTVLRHILAGNEHFTPGDSATGKSIPSISYKNNTLRFEYAAPFFEQEDKTVYQTWLEGFEDHWSDFDNNFYKEYTNLPAGKYHFHVRGKNVYQKLGDEAVYSFTILPPWYSSWWAYLIYALVAITIIYALVRWRTRQLHEKHRALEKTVKERTAQLSHRVEELAVINSVQEGLVAQMDMRSIYELVGEKIRKIFGAQIVDITTYDPGRNQIEDQYSFEKGDRSLLGPREPKGFRKHVIQKRQPILINEDMYRVSHEYESYVEQGELPKSAVFVPMIAGGEVTGIISLQNLDKEHAFSDSNVNLLTTLANSMSVALKSARLFDETTRLLKETEQRTAELSVINSVQDGLARELDIQGIYDLVGEKIREIFNAQVIDIVTYDKDKNLVEDKYSFEKGDRTMMGPRKPVGFGKHVIETGQLILVNEGMVQKSIEFNSKVISGEQPKSAVWVPLITGNEVKGVISLQNLDKEHAFTDSNVNLLTTLANSMSMALESARHFHETTRLLKITEDRAAELAVINSVQSALAAELNIQGIYDAVGDKIREIFDAQMVDIVTYDVASAMIYPRYVIERGERFYEDPRPLIGFRKHVIETRQPLLINEDIPTAAAQYGNPLAVQGEISKAVLFVPMIVGGEAKGIISLQNLDHENAFSESNVSLLSTLSNAMGVALESARLFDETTRLLKETEQRTAELSVINSVQEGLARELDIQGIYDLVGEKIRKSSVPRSLIL